MIRAAILAIACALSASLVGCGGGRSDATLTFTAVPDQDATRLEERFAPLAAHLSEALDVPVRYVPARDYAHSVELFRDGEVHLAWFGGLTGVQARAAVPGARAIAQGHADRQYFSYFIAHRSTGLERSDRFSGAIADLAFAFGSERSTSGRLMPEYFIGQFARQSPDEFFSRPYTYSGSHERTIELVASGRCEAGVVNFKVYERMVAEGDVDPDEVRVIWKTPFYANYNFTAHPELETLFGAGFIDTLQRVLVSIEDPGLLAALPRERLVPARDPEYAGIADVARVLDLLR
ncbi:putative selenate ABC transporter substrate-binding protein [bacterium]|nr:putative selenate ABC transporter substrate-binding protein [bacterium]